MPPLPIPPAPRPANASAGLPFARPETERAFPIDVPRYFIEVNVPGYSVEKALARARKRRQQQTQCGSASAVE
jgi:hypothetical protein